MALLCPSLNPFFALLWTNLRCLHLPVPGATLLLAFFVKLTKFKVIADAPFQRRTQGCSLNTLRSHEAKWGKVFWTPANKKLHFRQLYALECFWPQKRRLKLSNCEGVARRFAQIEWLTCPFLGVEVSLDLMKICFSRVSVVGMGVVVLLTKWLSSLGLHHKSI